MKGSYFFIFLIINENSSCGEEKAISKHRTRPNTSEKVTSEDQIEDESNISWHWLKATSGNWWSIFPMQEETKSGWHWQLAKPRLQIFIEKLRMHEKKWMNELPNLSFWGFTKVNHSCWDQHLLLETKCRSLELG